MRLRSEGFANWQVIFAIEQRISHAAFSRPGGYVVLTLGLILGSVLLHNRLRFAQLNAVLTTPEPLLVPLFFTTAFFSIFVGLAVAIEVARERASRTLEVLFYGPVTPIAFLFGHFLSGMRVYLYGMALVLVWANVVTWAVNLAFSSLLLMMFAASLVSAAATIAFGMLVGVMGGRTRNALIVFVGTVLLLVGLQGADVVVRDIIPPPAGATSTDPLVTLRTVLSQITYVIGWVSPYAQLQQLTNNLLDARPLQALVHSGVMLVQSIVLFGLSVARLRQVGAR
ncbi:MAG: ABC transporter permease [Chloroflexota bacterium]